MALYGWYCWRGNLGNKKPELSSKVAAKIKSWSLGLHLKIIALLALVSLLVGWLMASFTPTSFPYLDAATTVYAVFATYLVATKVLENWLYWVVIDLVSIYLYIEKGLVPTAALFILYVFMACYGYVKWLNKYKKPVF